MAPTLGMPKGPPPPCGATLTPPPSPALGQRLYQEMLRTRCVEEHIQFLYHQGRIKGGCYSGRGAEATSVGAAAALVEGDVLVPTHRDMGAHLVRGHSVLDIARQYLKRGTAQTQGRDTGLHLGREGSDIVGMISHLAHMLPVAAGVALAERQMGRDSVVLTTVGDGATSLGDFHEALNFIGVQKLPVIVIIVNNQYAYSTPPEVQYACEALSSRAVGYGLDGATIDGTDALLVHDTVSRAAARARAAGGGALIECRSMRMRGHSEHDDFRYVPKAQLEAWAAWDPLPRLQDWLEARGTAVDGWADAIRADVQAAFSEAEAEPDPAPGAATEGVYRHWPTAWTVPPGVQDEPWWP